MANVVYLSYTGGSIGLQNSGGTPALDLTYTPIGAPPDEPYVTEEARLRVKFSGTASSTFGAVVGSINRAFLLAREHAKGEGGDRVWLNVQPYSYPDVWRSEVINGHIKPQPDAWDKPLWEDNGVKSLTFDVTLTRRNYFEGTLTELPIANDTTGGTGALGGTLPVFNMNFVGASSPYKVNWFDVPGTAIAGDLPGYAKVVTTFDNAVRYLSVGESIWPSAFIGSVTGAGTTAISSDGTHYEFYDGPSGGLGTMVVDAASSGTSYCNLVLPYADTIMNLDPALAIKYNNSWYTFLVRMGGSGVYKFTTSFIDCYGTVDTHVNVLDLRPSGGTMNHYTFDAFRMPFGDYESTYSASWEQVYLTISKESGSDLKADYVQVMGADSLRHVELPYVVSAGTVIIDETEGDFYAYNTGINAPQSGVGYGGALALYPGKGARFMLAWSPSRTTTAPGTVHAHPRVYYRPRRLTI